MAWKPSTVEDIRKWMAGEYVPNPTDEEFWALLREKVRKWRADGTIPAMCLVPRDHPSRRPVDGAP